MADVKERSTFIHIDLPGQEDRAPDLPDEYDWFTKKKPAVFYMLEGKWAL